MRWLVLVGVWTQLEPCLVIVAETGPHSEYAGLHFMDPLIPRGGKRAMKLGYANPNTHARKQVSLRVLVE